MSERRRYFRIDDTVALDYRPINKAEADQLARELAHGLRGSGELLQGFHGADSRLREAIDRLRGEQPASADVADMLNEKMDRLARLLIGTRAQEKGSVRDVNLSATGLAFVAEDVLEKGSLLEMELVLFPGYQFLLLIAQVVDCESADDGQHIRVEFQSLRDEDRENLIRHIMQRQTAELRRQRGTDQTSR